MAVASMHLRVLSWSRHSPELQMNVRMGKKGDLGIFERGMVVGARRAGLSISQSAAAVTEIFTHNHFLGLKRMV